MLEAFNVTILLYDSYGFTLYNQIIIIKDTPPVFINFTGEFIINVGEKSNFTMAPTYDQENHTVSCIVFEQGSLKLPSFIFQF
jgi:hypothetical protein